MKKCSTTVMVVLILSFIGALPSIAHAATYNASGIIAIAVGSGGEVYIRWAGLPNPGPCGVNNNWVMILPTGNETLKALVLSLYFSGKPALIATSGCSGP